MPSRLHRLAILCQRRIDRQDHGGETMTMQTTESSHPLLSHADSAAGTTGDALLLIGRILLGWLFLTTAWGKLFGGIDGFAGYLRALKVPAPEFWAWIGAIVEFVVGVTLILGLATRYARLLSVRSLSAATALATANWNTRPHRWAPRKPTSSRILPSWAARCSCS